MYEFGRRSWNRVSELSEAERWEIMSTFTYRSEGLWCCARFGEGKSRSWARKISERQSACELGRNGGGTCVVLTCRWGRLTALRNSVLGRELGAREWEARGFELERGDARPCDAKFGGSKRKKRESERRREASVNQELDVWMAEKSWSISCLVRMDTLECKIN